MAGKTFKQWLNNYLSFSKKDRNAIITLGSLILLVFAGHFIIDNINLSSPLNHEKARQAINEWNRLKKQGKRQYSLFEFNPNTISAEQLDSLLLPEFVKRNILSYRNAGGKFNKTSDVRKIYGMNDSVFAVIESYIVIPETHFYEERKPVEKKVDSPESLTGNFDPNMAGRSTLLKYGFNEYQANNLLKYRNSGGSFNSPNDVLKIYGVDSAFFESIREHIQINYTEKNKKVAKQQPPLSVELNNATAEQLEELSGIGPVFATRIVKFRNLLGGFHSKEQLLEVYHLPEETYYHIEKNIYVDTAYIKPIRVNFADFGELIRHPYLREAEVKKILSYRQKNGSFKSVSQLYDAGIISDDIYNKVRPYLSCR